MIASKQGILNRILGRTGVTTKLENLQADSVLSPDVSADNYIINGGFDFWQRGTSFSPTNSKKYAADRMSVYDSNTQSTVTRVASSFAETEYGLKFQRTAGTTGTGSKYFAQSIEIKNSRSLIGKNVTFSFKIKMGANFSGSMTAYICTGTQTDDREIINSGYDGAFNKLASVSSSTQFKTVSLSMFVPQSAKQVAILIEWVPAGTAGADDSYTIEQLMLNIGSIAAPFVSAGKTIGGELALCQRYFEKSYLIDTALGTLGGYNSYICLIFNSYARTQNVAYKVTKRINVIPILYNGLSVANNWTWYNAGTSANDGGAIGDNTIYGFSSQYNGTGYSDKVIAVGHWSVDAEI